MDIIVIFSLRIEQRQKQKGEFDKLEEELSITYRDLLKMKLILWVTYKKWIRKSGDGNKKRYSRCI